MRKKEKEITDIAEIEDVLGRASVCRLGLCENDQPYVVPLCFGYKDKTLYFHCAGQGKKLDIIRNNNNVCFEADIDCEIVKADNPCDWTMKYKSVIGFGKAELIEDDESKRNALDIIMQHYTQGPFEYPQGPMQKTKVIKVEIETMTGKKSG